MYPTDAYAALPDCCDCGSPDCSECDPHPAHVASMPARVPTLPPFASLCEMVPCVVCREAEHEIGEFACPSCLATIDADLAEWERWRLTEAA